MPASASLKRLVDAVAPLAFDHDKAGTRLAA
jgi:hypothetical protein